MGQNARFALSLVILWCAFAAFYVAFHPGGIVMGEKDGKPVFAQNPSDVWKYMVKHMVSPGGEPAR